MSSYKKNSLKIIKILVALLLILFLINRLDVEEFLELIVNANYYLLLIPILLWPLSLIVSVWRWQLFLGQGVFSFKQLFISYWIGSFINNFLPSTVGGDAYKFLSLYQKEKITKKLLAKSLILERISGATIIGLLQIIISPFYFDRLNLVTVLPLLLSCGGIFVAFLLVTGKLKFKNYDLTCDLKIFFKSLFFSLFFFLLSVISSFAIFISFSTAISIPFLIYTLTAVSLIAYIPISINALGLKESYAVSIFGLFGYSLTNILAIFTINRILSILLSLSGGIYLFINQIKQNKS